MSLSGGALIATPNYLIFDYSKSGSFNFGTTITPVNRVDLGWISSQAKFEIYADAPLLTPPVFISSITEGESGLFVIGTATPATVDAYITNSGDGTVSVIDTTTNTVVKTIPVGSKPFGVAVTPDGSKIYIANSGDDTVSVINTATNTVIGSAIAVGTDPVGVAVTPDGKTVYVTNQGDGTVSVIDTATNTVIGSAIDVGCTTAK